MACTCRNLTDWEPYGDTYVARETFEQCDECYERDGMWELDEQFAEFNAEEVSR